MPEDGNTGQPVAFEWPVYADATFAGLSILIPIPLVDMLFEKLFHDRMPRAIARYRGRKVDRDTIRVLNRRPWSLAGCLLFPVWLVLVFLKRLFRTVLYFLTVKEATDKLSLYWHRAFLLDYSLRRGDLGELEPSRVAAEAIRSLLEEITTSPVNQLAAQVVGGARHVLRTVVRWFRRGVEDEVARAAHENMGRHWADLGAYFDALGRRYDIRFAEIAAAGDRPPAGPP